MPNIALEILAATAGRPDAVAMRYERDGRWHDVTYRTMIARIDAVAVALVGMGITPGDRVGIFAPNMPEWIIADYAAMSVRAVTVPIYATNSSDQVEAIVADSGLKVLFVGGEVPLGVALKISGRCGALASIVTLDSGPHTGDGRLRALADLESAPVTAAAEAEVARRRDEASADDIATIIYTSGTTGEPKGVVLRHRNFANQFSTVDARFRVGAGDRSLCFLPLSHAYERTWSAYVFRKGALNVILADPRRVVTALAETQPTVMVSAPRLYEKIHAAIMARRDAAPPLRRRLFDWAVRTGHAFWTARYADVGPGPALRLRHLLADLVVLRRIRAAVGGPKNFLSSGGAALAQEVEEFFLAVGLLVCQGYGLTETAPMLTCNAPGAFRFGTVGRPIDGVELRIAPTGEIQARGPNVTEGYYGKPEATAEAFTGGWFRTGDIGHFDDDGYLVITDRIKDLIITSGGKNIAPQRIEAIVGKDYYIDQLAVVGDRRSVVGAIIVPAFEALKDFAQEHRLQFRDDDELICLPEVVELYRQRILSQSADLAPFEQIRRFTLVARQFSQQAGEITPTLKVRRRVIAEKYRELIERMYGGTEPPENDAPAQG